MGQSMRKRRNERFLQRLLDRRPQDRERYESLLRQPPVTEAVALEAVSREAFPIDAAFARDMVLETIVDEERPVLFVKGGIFDTTEVTTLGPEAVDLVKNLNDASARLLPILPFIGRIDVTHFPGNDYLGTGWFVQTDIVVTNRHVASLIAKWDGARFVFSRGVGGRAIESSLCNAHEYDDLAPDATRVFKIREVLYIEPDSSPYDIAFLRVDRRSESAGLPYIPIAPIDVADNVPVCVVGYPARAPRSVIPDQELMQKLYRGKFDVKRAAPGFSMGTANGTSQHDCTTLGGNSGSVVLDLDGRAVGLHFAGLYQEANYAVPASVLADYVSGKRWTTPRVEIRPSASPPPTGLQPSSTVVNLAPAGGGSVTVTIPLTISVGLGTPVVGTPGISGAPVVTDGRPLEAAQVERAAQEYWKTRPSGVIAARVGYFEEGDEIGDRPCIAVSVPPARWGEFESIGPKSFQGVPIRYLPADVDEQIQALPALESVDSIAYDDDARTGANFSFDPIDEVMDVTLHVGPEYSWDVLKKFLDEGNSGLVSAMYEFHAPHIKDAIEERLGRGASLKLVLDNATFSTVKPGEFDRVEVFEGWANDHPAFQRIVAPEGTSGLISDSYHIKVTVRDDDKFWLSSGNWKGGSSQPVITQAQRDDAADTDLPGNREWHVVIRNATLANRFRSHILQDFARSTDLGGGPVPRRLMDETFVDVPLEEAVFLERKPPGRVLKPKKISRSVKVRPLLTPDREGAIFSKAVLKLIRSATHSLLFQIPYIGMPPTPDADRGYIDELIEALTEKLTTLDDARVILRSGGSKYSSPTHAAWYFKSKGVDIGASLRVIENHHTKGMIVDGRRVLLGSHNWSKPGVSLNRDASLIFDDEEIAEYYAEAFEIDWARANKIKPKKFVRESAIVREAVGAAPPMGYERVRLSDWLSDD